jgi:hypothetical protein
MDIDWGQLACQVFIMDIDWGQLACQVFIMDIDWGQFWVGQVDDRQGCAQPKSNGA